MFVLADVIAICFVDGSIATFDISCTKRCTTIIVFVSLLADVMAKMADGVAMFIIGRCYCHVADVLPLFCSFVLLADVIAKWLMECPPWVWMADVIAKVVDGLATESVFQF